MVEAFLGHHKCREQNSDVTISSLGAICRLEFYRKWILTTDPYCTSLPNSSTVEQCTAEWVKVIHRFGSVYFFHGPKLPDGSRDCVDRTVQNLGRTWASHISDLFLDFETMATRWWLKSKIQVKFRAFRLLWKLRDGWARSSSSASSNNGANSVIEQYRIEWHSQLEPTTKPLIHFWRKSARRAKTIIGPVKKKTQCSEIYVIRRYDLLMSSVWQLLHQQNV